MANAEKVAAVAELKERFETSSGAVLANYRGLTVAQLADLRRALDGHASFAVVKNTLTKLAATEAGVADQLGDLLTGPSAIAFVKGDVVEAAKGLREFAKANPALEIKGGIIDGKSMTPSEIASSRPAVKSASPLTAPFCGARVTRPGPARGPCGRGRGRWRRPGRRRRRWWCRRPRAAGGGS